MTKLFISALIFSISLIANTNDNNSSKTTQSQKATISKESPLYQKLLSLDYIQNSVSKKIHIFSSKLDHSLSNRQESDSNSSKSDAYSLYGIVDLYDDFFKDETYLNTTSRSFIRLKWGAETNYEEGFRYLDDIRVSLRLPKTEESLYLFVGEERDDEIKTTNSDRGVGLKYVVDAFDIVDLSLSGGFRGIDNPFAKLRFQYPIAFEKILFRPVQYIEYSKDREFKEQTQFYFDYRLEDKIDLVRLSLKRYTESRLAGMNYSTQLSYISTLKHSLGFQIYTSAYGQTKTQTSKPANTKYSVTPKRGLYNYSSGVIFRQKFFKKYLFYELHPIIEFDQQYDYNANYIFRAHLELYFGNI